MIQKNNRTQEKNNLNKYTLIQPCLTNMLRFPPFGAREKYQFFIAMFCFGCIGYFIFHFLTPLQRIYFTVFIILLCVFTTICFIIHYFTLIPIGRIFSLSYKGKGVWIAHLSGFSCFRYLKYNPHFYILHDFNYLLLLTLNDNRVKKIKTFTWLITPKYKGLFILEPTNIEKISYIKSIPSRLITLIYFIFGKIFFVLNKPSRIYSMFKFNKNKPRNNSVLIKIIKDDSYKYEWDMNYTRNKIINQK